MEAPTAAKTALLQFAFERVRCEHDHLSEQWKRLDDKAQASATIAGIFLAAAFAFLQASGVPLTVPQRWLLGGVVLLLVFAVGLAILATLVHDVDLPPTGKDAAEMVSHVLATDPAEYSERLARLLADTIDPWVNVNASLEQLVTTKGKYLLASQCTLFGAAAAIALLTGSVLWK